jgi:hypothetical protein
MFSQEGFLIEFIEVVKKGEPAPHIAFSAFPFPNSYYHYYYQVLSRVHHIAWPLPLDSVIIDKVSM